MQGWLVFVGSKQFVSSSPFPVCSLCWYHCLQYSIYHKQICIWATLVLLSFKNCYVKEKEKKQNKNTLYWYLVIPNLAYVISNPVLTWWSPPDHTHIMSLIGNQVMKLLFLSHSYHVPNRESGNEAVVSLTLISCP